MSVTLRSRGLFFCLAGVFFLAGCYGGRFDALEEEITQTRQELDRLRQAEERRGESVTALEETSRRSEEALRLIRATDTARHQEVMERLVRLEGVMSDSDDRVGLLAERWDESRWVIVPPDTGAPAEAEREAARPGEGTAAEDEAVPVSPVGAGAELRRAYEAARLDLTQGQYDLAASAFREFLRRFPDSELSDNAQYWLGECYYAQQKFDDALREFQRVIANYPRADKVPASFLKMGFSLLSLGRREEAISLLKRVASDYPHTPEAERALDRLKSLAETQVE